MIELPFPHKALWPNARPHWATKAREFKKHKEWAFFGARHRYGVVLLKEPADRIDWSVVVHPKTRHRIDADNAISSLKAYQDGIAGALGIDDNLFNAPELTFGEPIKGGLVRIWIKPLEGEKSCSQ